jgi:hypothetical protein
VGAGAAARNHEHGGRGHGHRTVTHLCRHTQPSPWEPRPHLS